jgi:hypothetical protein
VHAGAAAQVQHAVPGAVRARCANACCECRFSTSLRQAAAEAAESMGMVRHYFAGKEEMVLFALRSMTERVGTTNPTRTSLA